MLSLIAVFSLSISAALSMGAGLGIDSFLHQIDLGLGDLALEPALAAGGLFLGAGLLPLTLRSGGLTAISSLMLTLAGGLAIVQAAGVASWQVSVLGHPVEMTLVLVGLVAVLWAVLAAKLASRLRRERFIL